MRKVISFLRLPFGDKRLFCEAVIFLSISRIFLRLFPFRFLARFLGACSEETPLEDSSGQRDNVRRISWAVRTSSRNLPWRSTCLMEAVAGKFMLNRRGIFSSLYLGVRMNRETDKEDLEAHAWLRSGTIILTGTPNHGSYKTLTVFGTK